VEDESSDTSHAEALCGPSLTVEKEKNKVPSTTPPPDLLQTVSTWGDMKTLGRLLHLHPLTLEDILQWEPRDKLESFPKLGYYFIIFRAIDYTTQNELLEIVSQKTGSSQLPAQGAANETCM